MLAYEIHRNGKRLAVAGLDGDCVLSTIVTHVEGRGGPRLDLHVGGLITATEEHVIWRNTRLKLGDEVKLRIVEANRVDRPQQKYKMDSKQNKKNSKAYVLAICRKYGWKLVTSQER